MEGQEAGQEEEAREQAKPMPDANQQREEAVPEQTKQGPGQQGIHGSTSGGTGTAGMEPSPSSSGQPGRPDDEEPELAPTQMREEEGQEGRRDSS